jgi:hypothetical protein
MMRNLLIILLACCTSAIGQTLSDPVYINVTKITRPGGSLLMAELNAGVPPIAIFERITWINTLYYRNTRLDNPAHRDSELPRTLHDIRYTSIIRASIAPRTEVVFIPRLMIRSDLAQSLSRADFFPQIVLLGTYAVGRNLKLGLGAALNNDFDRNAIIPIGSLNYDGARFKVEIVYPNAHFLYKHSQNIEFGLFANVDGAISNVNNPNRDTHYVRFFQVLAAPTISVRLATKVFAHFKTGISFARTFEVLDENFNTITSFNEDPSWFVRGGIGLRIN